MSPQIAPPASEVVADRGAVLDQLTRIALTLSELDSNLTHGNVLAARETSTLLRSKLGELTRTLGFAI